MASHLNKMICCIPTTLLQNIHFNFVGFHGKIRWMSFRSNFNGFICLRLYWKQLVSKLRSVTIPEKLPQASPKVYSCSHIYFFFKLSFSKKKIKAFPRKSYWRVKFKLTLSYGLDKMRFYINFFQKLQIS